MKRVAFTILTTLLVVTMAFWAAGCDLTKVDEGADLTTTEQITALSSASSPEAAKKAIRHILNKAEIGLEGQLEMKEGPYAGYKLKSGDLESVAEAQAAFVRGDVSQGMTFRQIFEETKAAREKAIEIMVQTPVTPVVERQIQANMEEVLAVFKSEADAAVKAPEEPVNAMIATAAARGSALPAEIEPFGEDEVLSPARQLLFRIWLDQNGPNIMPFMFTDDAAGQARAAQCKTPPRACCGSSESKFVSITLQYIGLTPASVRASVSNPQPKAVAYVYGAQTLQPGQLFTVDGSQLNRGNNGFNGTIGNELSIYANNERRARIHTSCSVPVLPGEIYGDLSPVNPLHLDLLHKSYFKVIAIKTKSNGLCFNKELCLFAAKARLIACLASSCGNETKENACYVEFKQNDQICHKQGFSN